MLLTVSVAQVALPYLVARMPKNKTTSRGSARSQLVHFSTHGCWRSSNHLFSNAPISLPRWTVSSQSAPSRDSLPSSPDIGLVPASAPSGQLDLSSMTMYSLVRFIQSQNTLLSQAGAISMSSAPQPTSSLPQPVVTPLASI